MAKFTQEQLTQIASNSYAECVEIVKEMGALVQTVQEDFSIEIALRQFDLILQATLLNAAVANDELADCELDFVGGIAQYSDILPVVNAAIKEQEPSWEPIGWGDLLDLETDTLKKFALIAGACVEKYAEEFVSFFAVVDKVIEEKDYMDLLFAAVTKIAIAISGYDGDDLESEISDYESLAALAMYATLVNDRWKAIVESND